MGSRWEMMKVAASKALVIKINVVFLALFVAVYATLVLQPALLDGHSAASVVLCSLRDCHLEKAEEGVAMKVVEEKRITKEKFPTFLDELLKNARIGLVNMEAEEVSQWSYVAPVQFQRVSNNFEWSDLFPEWIDEEEENDGPMCPEIPMPDFSKYGEMDVVVAKLPCGRPEPGWRRDVYRLQVHLIVANLAVRGATRDGRGKVRLVFLSACRPMIEMFRCDDMVRREGNWWMYEVEVGRLEKKVAMPLGSCSLALPLWREGTNEKYDLSKFSVGTKPGRREAYATVLHSSEAYVCGAITLAQSIKKTGSTRDLVLLHDKSLPEAKLQALINAGWKLREIERIRNPHAEQGTYNEYNYSKLRLWQLIEYHKVVFVDSDIIVLKNLDLLFHFPQMSATGNDGVIFNSGIMVIEPSDCTFKILMKNTKDIISYNGGDQGFLNEVFVWWHRLPRRVNFLKNFWANTTGEASLKNYLFGADPPELYAIHYLGLKPWLCYRDYDCNWNIDDQRVYASDIAHRRWWKLHDEMDIGLQKFCGLSERRKVELAWDRKKAGEIGFADGHWSWNVTDTRRNE